MKQTNQNRKVNSLINIYIEFFSYNSDRHTNSGINGLFKINNLSLILLLLVLPGIGLAQVKSNGTIANSISLQNPFFDASTNFNSTTNLGKGLVFPRTNLTNYTFKVTSLDGFTFPTAFDGMLVYNIGTGNTISGQGVVTAVTPGFYYFSNPTGTTSINSGKWVRISDKSDLATAVIVNNGSALATGGQIYDFTLQQISESIRNLKPRIFERELVDSENNINVGFALNANTQIFYNGQALSKNLWTGVGTAIIYLNLNTKQYDNIIVKR